MGNLPEVRVSQRRAFLNVGLDYGGPFNLKMSRNITTKGYICLFVCLSTKAVHLEVAVDLSSKAFLNCLKRFIARRGKCINIYSDNGSNFVGARNELQELSALLRNKHHQSQTENYATSKNIQWHFIPAYAPHMGGIWEAGIRSVKTHLKKVIGYTLLTYEEFYTVLVEIEACLNSRPLTPISTDPTDFTALTPGHFLIGTALTSIIQPDVQDVPSNRLTRYELLNKFEQIFWTRWRNEYLSSLQARYKWKSKSPNKELNVGTMDILKDDKLPPKYWKIGRIVELHKGKDNHVRVASVKIVDGIDKRNLNKICVLPCN